MSEVLVPGLADEDPYVRCLSTFAKNGDSPLDRGSIAVLTCLLPGICTCKFVT